MRRPVSRAREAGPLLLLLERGLGRARKTERFRTRPIAAPAPLMGSKAIWGSGSDVRSRRGRGDFHPRGVFEITDIGESLDLAFGNEFGRRSVSVIGDRVVTIPVRRP